MNKETIFYKIPRFFYRLVFINPKYLFGKIGFFQKTKIDFYGVIGKSNYLIKHGKNLKFYPPGLDVLEEKNGFERMTGLNNILDLGGFVGDSAIILSEKNRGKIFTFEPEKKKFELILENIKLNNLNKKIIAFNYAIVARDVKKLEFNKSGDFSPGSSIEKGELLEETEIVRCMNIKNVMKLENFEGLKCDIEGGEFEIIKYFLNNKEDFKFEKGIIEWHFKRDNSKQKKILLNFLSYLEKNNYSFFFYPLNNPNKILNEKEELKNILKQNFKGSFYDHINKTYVNMFYFEKNKIESKKIAII